MNQTQANLIRDWLIAGDGWASMVAIELERASYSLAYEYAKNTCYCYARSNTPHIYAYAIRIMMACKYLMVKHDK